MKTNHHKKLLISSIFLFMIVITLIVITINDSYAFYTNSYEIEILTGSIGNFKDNDAPIIKKFYLKEDVTGTQKYTNQVRNLAYISWEDEDVASYCLNTEGTKEACSVWNDASSSAKEVEVSNYSLEYGDGTKTVYAFIKDYANNVSEAKSDSIILDVTNPECGDVVKTSVGSSGVSGTVGCIDVTSGCVNEEETFSNLKSTTYKTITDKAGNTNSCEVPVSKSTSSSYYTKKVCSCKTYNTSSGSVCGECVEYSSCTSYKCPSDYPKSLGGSLCGKSGTIYANDPDPNFSCSKACSRLYDIGVGDRVSCVCYKTTTGTCSGGTCGSWPSCEDSSFGCKTWNTTSSGCTTTYPSTCTPSESNTSKTTCTYHSGSTSYS